MLTHLEIGAWSIPLPYRPSKIREESSLNPIYHPNGVVVVIQIIQPVNYLTVNTFG